MSLMNLLIHLNSYKDDNQTNDPSLNSFKWTRDIQGLTILEPLSRCLNLTAGQSSLLFSGTVSTSADATTTWDLALKSGSSILYQISHIGGTAPYFRTPRTGGHAADTEVTITKNSKLLTFTSTGGTLFDFVTGSVQVGDEVRIGTVFNATNRGKFKILSFTATSFTIENEAGQAEGPIILGVSYASMVNIFSADGIQIGEKIDIIAGFSSTIFGTYNILDVSHDYIEFASSEQLPIESGVSNNPEAFIIYNNSKSFVFIESNKKLDIKVNGSAITNEIAPMQAGTILQPGFFMSSASIKSIEIINKSLETASIFYVTGE